MKGPPARREKTYRMYIEEIPGKEAMRTESGGKVSFLIRNQGCVPFIIRSIKITGRDADGSEVFSDKSQGWYLHAGMAKAVTREIPKSDCPKVRRVNVEVTTGKPTLSGALEVQQSIGAP